MLTILFASFARWGVVPLASLAGLFDEMDSAGHVDTHNIVLLVNGSSAAPLSARCNCEWHDAADGTYDGDSGRIRGMRFYGGKVEEDGMVSADPRNSSHVGRIDWENGAIWLPHGSTLKPTPAPTLPPPAPAPFANATRVMPMGDSITFGCGDQCAQDCMAPTAHGKLAPCSSCSAGFRGPLWASLAAGAAGDARRWAFVGTQSNGDFAQCQHEGHPGWTIPQLGGIVGGVAGWAALAPDVILLHAGTNDLGGVAEPVATPADAAMRMRALLNATYAALPRVHVVLASIIGSTSKYGGAQHAAFNALLPAVAASFSAAGHSIEFLDMAQLSGIGSDCNHGCCPVRIHPNDQGYRAMAGAWLPALQKRSIFKSGFK